MNELIEQIERMIVRSLDGALSDDERIELDRELIRNPHARQLMDEYRRVDELSAAALADIAREGTGADRVVACATQPALPRPGRFRRRWLFVPGAVAAAILALVIPKPGLDSLDRTRAPVLESPVTGSVEARTAPFVRPFQRSGLMTPVALKPSVRRRTGRDLIGVMGDDGNLYWIEVERSRTIRLPKRRLKDGGSFKEL